MPVGVEHQMYLAALECPTTKPKPLTPKGDDYTSSGIGANTVLSADTS